MKKQLLLLAAVLLIAVAALVTAGRGAYRFYTVHYGFTPWMSLQEQSELLKKYDTAQPGEQSFWNQGHWITAAEGRWQDGIPQYRLRIVDAPKEQGYSWYWYFNQDKDAFNKKIHTYSDGGYRLVYWNAFQWPDGSKRYQGVWQKLGAKKP